MLPAGMGTMGMSPKMMQETKASGGTGTSAGTAADVNPALASMAAMVARDWP